MIAARLHFSGKDLRIDMWRRKVAWDGRIRDDYLEKQMNRWENLKFFLKTWKLCYN